MMCLAVKMARKLVHQSHIVGVFLGILAANTHRSHPQVFCGPASMYPIEQYITRKSKAMRRRALVLCWALATPLPALAAAPVDAWELIHPQSFDWRATSQRRAVAQDLSRRLNLLASVVPPQSPEQRDRVLAEMAELDRLGMEASPRRRGRLYISRGYQHFHLLELIDETRSDLDCILAATDIRKEMHCWSLAARHFGDEARLDLALAMLRRARLIPRDEQMPVTAQDPEVWYGEYGRGILQHILIPYLADAALSDAPTRHPDGDGHAVARPTRE